MPNYKNIAIIGNGPAASALAILLTGQGCKTVIFSRPSKAPITVGESLVPMIVPMLQTLGVEKEIAAYSTLKPGACFSYDADELFQFRFNETPDDVPSYSYNVPRDKFNATLLNKAQISGARLIEREVHLSADKNGLLRLDNDALQAAQGAWDNQQPDLIVDAAGRVNLIGRLLNIPMQKGNRQDRALFAHVDQTELVDPGYVHNDRIEQGWCWRIPLPGKVSLGFVVPESYALQHGETAQAQYDNILKADKVMQKLAPNAKRLTEVLPYQNYQSVSATLYGKNWAMLGDSGGFVDPVFSSGLLIAMTSAFQLAEINSRNNSLDDYEKQVKHHITAWNELVDYYYDGRLMTSIKVGDSLEDNGFNRLILPWIKGHVSRIFSGAAASRPFSMKLLRFLVTYGLRDRNPETYKIK